MINKKENFIIKAREIHGDKYDYSKVNYINCDEKVCIICPEHGEFMQTPYIHLHGSACPQCGQLKSKKNKTLSDIDFIKKANNIHKSKYDYSKVNYINNRTKVCIICPEHGEFMQTPSSHLSGRGCPQCANNNKLTFFNLTTEEFIDKAKNIQGNKYDYSKVKYINAKTKVCIICPEHGEFEQTPSSHLSGCGCPQCGIKTVAEKKKSTNDEFIIKSNEIHGDKYDYSKVNYITAKDDVTIICPKHGEFEQTPDAHIHGSGCPKCSNSISGPENELFDFLTSNLKIKVEKRNRTIISPMEIDIFVPKINLGIEYNGLYWHSEKFKKNKFHLLEKTLKSNEKGIKLIHIFEDEWLDKRDIVLSKIKHLCLLDNSPKIFGRKTFVHKIDKNEGEKFLEKYHIQGKGISSLYYGAYFRNQLIAVMSFKKENNENEWELTRFASDYNYICCGVGGKLFRCFIKEYNPTLVKSFADRRWTINEKNNLYIQLGFNFDSYIPPDYRYFFNGKYQRIHKFNLRKKNILKKYGKKFNLNENMTEKEMTQKMGLLRVYDCGLIKYIWKKEK